MSDDVHPYSTHQPMAERISPSEPVFFIRAQDALAPTIIWAWIAEAMRRGVALPKILAAMDHFAAVVTWQTEHPDRVKLPD